MTEKKDTSSNIRDLNFCQKVVAIGLAAAYVKCDPAPTVVGGEGYTGKEKLPKSPTSLKIATLAQQINHALIACVSRDKWNQAQQIAHDLNAPRDFDPEVEFKDLLKAAEPLGTKTSLELLQEAQKHIKRILKQAA